MTIACFRHFQRRAWDAVDIDVENPQYERDGWSSIHTIVQIAHPNMPFITDSVLMELSQHGLITHHLQNMVFAAVRDADGNLLHIDPQAQRRACGSVDLRRDRSAGRRPARAARPHSSTRY